MKALKVLFFDVGYTLINEDEVWHRRCIEQAESDEAKALGLTPEQIYEEIIQASLMHLPQYRTVIRKFGFRNPAPYRHELERLYEDAVPALESLAEKYQLGIIANQTDGLRQRLRHLGIDKYFRYVISSWDCGVMKPDPEIFRIALKRADCAPEEAMMVGDRLDNDIRPAKGLGFRTTWIKKGFGGLQSIPSDSFRPDYIVHSLQEIAEILCK